MTNSSNVNQLKIKYQNGMLYLWCKKSIIVISMQEGHIFTGTDADVALRNEATLVHILTLYSEATVC